MDKEHEKLMLDLNRLMAAANLKTKEDYERFGKEMIGKTIPRFEKEALSKEELAQDLVYQASESEDLLQGDMLVFEALQLDADCVEAYEFMGDMAVSPLQSLMFFKIGLTTARKKLGEKFFKQNKGHFWGIHETRAYMRCLKSYAECLYMLDRKEDALNTYFELLELNPNDNQGNRDFASLYCLELNNFIKYQSLHKQYNEDATAFHHFNYALFQFITKGDCEESRVALAEARSVNNHVLQLMLSKKELPELPATYGFGDKNEAVCYCTFAKDVWQNKKGAIEWLSLVYNKR